MIAARDLRVAFVGDSFVAGKGDPHGSGWVGRVVAASHAAGTPLVAYNLGVAGETSADILRRWRGEALPRLSTAADGRVVFAFGANDAVLEGERPRIAADASAANLAEMLVESRALGLSAFVVGPAPLAGDAHRERVVALSERFAAVAAAHRVQYLDIADALAAGVWQDEARAGDGAHPAAGGYELLASLVAEPLLRWFATAPS